jgi:CRP/FNR family transcriptional regulator, anaerobic regulatory protein
MRGIAMSDYASTGVLDFAAMDWAAPRDKGQPSGHHQSPRPTSNGLKSLHENAGHRTLVREGAPLVFRGDQFHDLYAVRSGSFKAYINDPRGREQRLGTFTQGDIIGFDAIETGRHRVSFVALERSEVVAIPFDVLTRFSDKNPGLLAVIMHRMASKIALP